MIAYWATIFLSIIYTVRGDSSELVWAREIGTTSSDVGYGISSTTDGSSIYVTGNTSTSLNEQPWAGGSDILLLKYNSSGYLMWSRQTGTSGADIGYGVSSSADGSSIYVAGYTSASLNGQPWAGDSDIVLLKYNSSGYLMWTRQTGTPGTDIGYGVSSSADGSSIYVAGSTFASLNGQPWFGGTDIVLLKYDSSGYLMWTRQTGTTVYDIGYSVSSTADGSSVFVTGSTQGSLNNQPYAGGSSDIVLLKYNSSGFLMWTRLEGTPNVDAGYGVYSVPDGSNIFVTGSYFSDNYYIVLLKYDSSGSLIWTQELGATDSEFGIGKSVYSSADGSSIYVTGTKGSMSI